MKADLILDPVLRRGFEREGFAVTPLLDADDITEISTIYDSFPSGMSTGFYTTLWSEDLNYRRAVRDVVTRVLSRRLKGILASGRIILAQLAVKQAGGGDSTCPMHADWSFVDESVHQPISLWIPLVNITPEVGPLKVVPGSHRVFRRIRPNQPQSVHYSPLDDIMPILEESRSREVLMHAGEAILYDGAIIHGSRGNKSERDRVAVVAIVVPEGAQLYHYWQEDMITTEVFEVDEEFLATEVRWGTKPTGRNCIEVLDLPSRSAPYTLAEFDAEISRPTIEMPTSSTLDPWRAVTPWSGLQDSLDWVGLGTFDGALLLTADQREQLSSLSRAVPADSYRRQEEIRKSVRDLLSPIVEQVMPTQEIVQVLLPNEEGSPGWRAAPSIVDVARHRSFEWYLAVGEECVERRWVDCIEGSHVQFRRTRMDEESPTAIELDPALVRRLSRRVFVDSHDWLCVDSRLFRLVHSLASSAPGGLLCVRLAPKEAMLRVYRTGGGQPGKHEVLVVQPNADGGRSWGIERSLGTIEDRSRPIELAELTSWLARTDQRDQGAKRPPALEELSQNSMRTKSMTSSNQSPDQLSGPLLSRRIFHDSALESRFRHQGYVIVPFLDEREVKTLFDFFQAHSPPNIAGFHGTMYHNDREYRVRVDEFVRPMLDQAAKRWLIDYRCSMCNFMVKEPGEAASEMPLHQDWSFVKEPELRSVHIWCPVVDVNHENGNLAVVPGTHHFSDNVRAFADMIPFQDQLGLLRERYTRELPMRAGEAVLFDGRLVHSSPPNMSSSRRITAQAIGIPNESPIYHSWRSSPTQVETFMVPDAFFLDYVLHQRPQGVEPTEVIEYVARQRTAEELSALDQYQEELPVR